MMRNAQGSWTGLLLGMFLLGACAAETQPTARDGGTARMEVEPVDMKAAPSDGAAVTSASAEKACLDVADAVAKAAHRCGENYQTSYNAFLDAAAGGSCKNILKVRDSASLYSMCIPFWNKASCTDLKTDKFDPSCSKQLIR